MVSCHSRLITHCNYFLDNSYTHPVDNSLDTPKGTLKLSTCLTRWVRFTRNAEPRRVIAQAAAMMLSGVLCILPVGAHALAENVSKYKLYAATKTDSIIELYAMDVLYTAESNWRVKAVNGTHFGICQGKSKYLKTANYKQQIDWCWRYSMVRYGSMVNALYHWKVYGWH